MKKFKFLIGLVLISSLTMAPNAFSAKREKFGADKRHAEVHDMGHHHGAAYGTVHIWTLICLSLGILGPNERAYLGDDLKDVDVFHPESSLF